MLGTGDSSAAVLAHVGFVEVDVFLIRAVPHAWEKHLAGSFIPDLSRTVRLDILVAHRSPVCRSLNFIRSIEILAVDQRIAAVLLASQIADQCERIVRLILVGRGLCS